MKSWHSVGREENSFPAKSAGELKVVMEERVASSDPLRKGDFPVTLRKNNGWVIKNVCSALL